MAPTMAKEIAESSASAESDPLDSAAPSPSVPTVVAPADAEIATLAYALWEARGRLDGCAEQDWLAAEASLRQDADKI
jgi:Protein of unknown function (DUF2934)